MVVVAANSIGSPSFSLTLMNYLSVESFKFFYYQVLELFVVASQVIILNNEPFNPFSYIVSDLRE